MKKGLFASVIVVSVLLIWYLLIKPFELTSTLTYATSEGAIFQTVKLWSEESESIDVIESKAPGRIVQNVVSGDQTYSYQWEIEKKSNSLTEVTVSLTDPERRLYNKLTIPFVETEIETTGREKLREFDRIMTEHMENIKVEIVGIDTIKRFKCVFIPIKTSQRGKALGMMQSYSLLSQFVAENQLDVNRVPFIEVTKWDEQQENVAYNFGYPINEEVALPESDFFKYKWVEEVIGIKAIYNGNYITSDRAWYALRDYADDNKLKILDKPIEFFYDNPNFGYREKEWRTEVFLPLK